MREQWSDHSTHQESVHTDIGIYKPAICYMHIIWDSSGLTTPLIKKAFIQTINICKPAICYLHIIWDSSGPTTALTTRAFIQTINMYKPEQ